MISNSVVGGPVDSGAAGGDGGTMVGRETGVLVGGAGVGEGACGVAVGVGVTVGVPEAVVPDIDVGVGGG